MSAPPLGRTFAACTGVLVLALLLLAQATDGGRAFTTETLRRSEVARQAWPVPPLVVRNARGEVSDLRDVLARDGRVWIVGFIYTRCNTLCLALGTEFQRLQQQIESRGLQQRVGLLSVSFDPAHDDAAALADYAQRMRLQPGIWQVRALAEAGDRRRLLDAFGIMVIPAPLGEWEHNAALHVVSARGELVRILDLNEIDYALDAALAFAGGAD
jgi:protein SCO1/2